MGKACIDCGQGFDAVAHNAMRCEPCKRVARNENAKARMRRARAEGAGCYSKEHANAYARQYKNTDTYKDYRRGQYEKENQDKRDRRRQAKIAAGLDPDKRAPYTGSISPADLEWRSWMRVIRDQQREMHALDKRHIEALRLIAKGPRKSSLEVFKHRYKTDAAFNLKIKLMNTMTEMCNKFTGLTGERMTKHMIWKMLGYNEHQLLAHFVNNFSVGMSVDRILNADIHIDHIVPRSYFDCASVDEIVAANQLHNLRPLWAKENWARPKTVDEHARKAMVSYVVASSKNTVSH